MADEEKIIDCRICLEDIVHELAELDSCSHVFHPHCIRSWSEVNNSCPLCKRRFHVIEWGRIGGRQMRKRRIEVADKEQEAPEESSDEEAPIPGDEPEDERCLVCRSDEDTSLFLLCDVCNRACHMDCLNPRLERVPEGSWFCDDCKGEQDRALSRLFPDSSLNEPPPSSANEPSSSHHQPDGSTEPEEVAAPQAHDSLDALMEASPLSEAEPARGGEVPPLELGTAVAGNSGGAAGMAEQKELALPILAVESKKDDNVVVVVVSSSSEEEGNQKAGGGASPAPASPMVEEVKGSPQTKSPGQAPVASSEDAQSKSPSEKPTQGLIPNAQRDRKTQQSSSTTTAQRRSPGARPAPPAVRRAPSAEDRKSALAVVQRAQAERFRRRRRALARRAGARARERAGSEQKSGSNAPSGTSASPRNVGRNPNKPLEISRFTYKLVIRSGKLIEDRYTPIQAHVAMINSKEDVYHVMKALKSLRETSGARCFTMAYRVRDKGGNILSGRSDDTEERTGLKLLRVLEMAQVIDVVAIVTQWAGLAPLSRLRRFRAIQTLSYSLLRKLEAKGHLGTAKMSQKKIFEAPMLFHKRVAAQSRALAAMRALKALRGGKMEALERKVDRNTSAAAKARRSGETSGKGKRQRSSASFEMSPAKRRAIELLKQKRPRSSINLAKSRPVPKKASMEDVWNAMGIPTKNEKKKQASAEVGAKATAASSTKTMASSSSNRQKMPPKASSGFRTKKSFGFKPKKRKIPRLSQTQQQLHETTSSSISKNPDNAKHGSAEREESFSRTLDTRSFGNRGAKLDDSADRSVQTSHVRRGGGPKGDAKTMTNDVKAQSSTRSIPRRAPSPAASFERDFSSRHETQTSTGSRGDGHPVHRAIGQAVKKAVMKAMPRLREKDKKKFRTLSKAVTKRVLSRFVKAHGKDLTKVEKWRHENKKMMSKCIKKCAEAM